MNLYTQTLSKLYGLQQFSIKMGLENITQICDFLNNPQNSYPIIHVAGTNGKGSTSRMIQAILSSHGLRVGLYTSPHLVDFRERITIDDKQIEKEYIVKYWQQISNLIYRLKSTFFDTTTALAFDYFRYANVDVAVIETGLGGRLDSTNIVDPLSVVITPIEIDHTKQLGTKLKSIALEKASIIKSGAAVFLANQKKLADDVLIKVVSNTNEYYRYPDSLKLDKISTGVGQITFNLYDRIRDVRINQIQLNLSGSYQTENAGLAYLCSRWFLDRSKMTFSDRLFRKTLKYVKWSGRLQLISKVPLIYFDVSHNYAGFKHTLEFADKIYKSGNRYLLFGLLDDKAYKPIVKRIQKSFKNVMITEPDHARALSTMIISDEFKKYDLKTMRCKSITEAYEKILKKLTKDDVLFVMGSHYIIGELLRFSGKNT